MLRSSGASCPAVVLRRHASQRESRRRTSPRGKGKSAPPVQNRIRPPSPSSLSAADIVHSSFLFEDD
ncbi:hypothetical protein EYF80_040964 [Liparis tanakae]|uniref:Uncharacterized protein n=1 Tax=Liparis tanakae TaxID=230148 RepID=A0A4Z2G6T2_9TELE|nr:hypothetical protein EYF80_040964 [Liparis tanakae]